MGEPRPTDPGRTPSPARGPAGGVACPSGEPSPGRGDLLAVAGRGKTTAVAALRSLSDDRGRDRVRVYLPATTTVLQRLLDEGRLEGPHTVFTVTPQLREFYELSDSDEELEYAALIAAARASLRLIDVDPAAARRRVVLAADVPDASVTPIEDEGADAGAARTTADIALRDVASAHIDVADAEDDVRAAVDVVLEADLGSEDAQFVVDQAEGHELAWYASQEIGPALDLL